MQRSKRAQKQNIDRVKKTKLKGDKADNSLRYRNLLQKGDEIEG